MLFLTLGPQPTGLRNGWVGGQANPRSDAKRCAPQHHQQSPTPSTVAPHGVKDVDRRIAVEPIVRLSERAGRFENLPARSVAHSDTRTTDFPG